MVEYQLPKLGTRVRFPSLAPCILGLLVIVFFAAGCGTTKYVGRPDKGWKTKGIYHKVQDGETIWRIAKTYGVTIDDIVTSNHIPNAAYVKKNQLVFIPGADEVKEIDPVRDDPNKEEFSWPVKGKILNFFGEQRGPYSNRGIGIQAQEGQMVQASREGRVVFADYLTGYAYTIILDHLDGYLSVYSQNAKLLVGLGDLVFKGGRIAQVGRNGNPTFMHFEIRKNGRADNPLYYLPH